MERPKGEYSSFPLPLRYLCATLNHYTVLLNSIV